MAKKSCHVAREAKFILWIIFVEKSIDENYRSHK
jgi:hypothetical protein